MKTMKRCNCGHLGYDVTKTGDGNECASCKAKRIYREHKCGLKPSNALLGLAKFAGRGGASHQWLADKEQEEQRDPNRVPGWAWPEYAAQRGLV